VRSKKISNQSLIELDETLLTTQVGYFFYRNNYMFHLTNRAVGALIPAGIMQNLNEYHFWFTEGKPEAEEDEGPSVLSVTDLSFGFVIWLAACGISTFIFAIEWSKPRIKRLIRTTIGLVLFLTLLNRRLRQIY
jgi:hypothetical protein